MCSEAEARRILKGDRAEAIVGIVEGGWQDHVDEGYVRSDRARAIIVWDYMTARASAALALPGVEHVDEDGIPIFVFDKRLALRFKKHDRELNTSNVRTDHQDSFRYQEPLAGMPETTHLSCGYVLDQAQADVERIVVVKHIGWKREWFIDMRDLAAGVLEPTMPMLPTLDEDEPGLPGIAPQHEETTGEDDDG